jgi:hypothetical protein
LKTVARELDKCKLDLVGVQEVMGEKGGTEGAEDYTFLYGERKEYHQLGAGFFVHNSIIPAVRRVEFIGDRMSCITLKGRWCDIIILMCTSPPPPRREDKHDGVNDSFCEEQERVFDQFPMYDTIIPFGNFNAKVGRHIFKLTIGNGTYMKLLMIIE